MTADSQLRCGPGNATFNELARASEIGKGVGEDYDRCHQERSQKGGSGKLAVDGERGRSFHQALIDAEKTKTEESSERTNAPDCSRLGTTPENTGNNSKIMSSTEIRKPCMNRETRRNHRSPRTESTKHSKANTEGGEQSTTCSRQKMTGKKARQIGRVGGRDENNRRKDIRIEQKSGDKDGDRRHTRKKLPQAWNGQGFEHKQVKEIGKEKVPLENRRDADGDE